MTVPHVWWHSRYDHQAHAFPAAQAASPDQRRLEAFCQHTATPKTMIHRDIGNPCPTCLHTTSRQPTYDPRRPQQPSTR